MNETTTTAPAPSKKYRKRRTWSEAKKARVLAYYAKHGTAATLKRYDLASSMLSKWQKKGKRGKGSAPGSGRSPVKVPSSSRARANGTALQDAVIYLQHAESATLAAGRKPTNAELYALLALRRLQGEL